MILIADDFGLGRLHDEAILRLLAAGRLHGTSVMVGGAVAPDHVAQLRALRSAGRAQVGLHLNLTQAMPGQPATQPIGALLRAALTGGLDKARIARNFAGQMAAFERLMGFAPDFIDGHQHCHVIPGIAPLAAALPHGPQVWARIPAPATAGGVWRNLRAGGVKTLLVVAMAMAARRAYRRAGWRLSADFSGFLRLDQPARAGLWLTRLIAAAGPRCVVMVHPGDAADPVQTPGHDPQTRNLETELLT